MDRRGFLKFAAALPPAAYLPEAGADRPMLSVSAIKGAIQRMQGHSQGDWYCFLHPSQEQDLRDLAARDRWHYAHKQWRKDGRPPLTCQGILDKYTPMSEFDFPTRPEIGSYEGVRFIQSERLTA